jgi:hypothetical protein
MEKHADRGLGPLTKIAAVIAFLVIVLGVGSDWILSSILSAHLSNICLLLGPIIFIVFFLLDRHLVLRRIAASDVRIQGAINRGRRDLKFGASIIAASVVWGFLLPVLLPSAILNTGLGALLTFGVGVALFVIGIAFVISWYIRRERLVP